ncbi:MAG: hypothetical protein ACYCSX_14745 [Acidimicrobiales bacterium]
MTAPQTPNDQILDSVRALLAAQGLTPEDLVARAAHSTEPGAATTAYPTLRQRVERVERGLTKNTKRTWKTHLDRLLDGTPKVCECLCDACLDLEAGCTCGCATCEGSKLSIEGRPDLVLSPTSVVRSDVEEWATVAERYAQKKAAAENKVRVQRGLSTKPASGQGGRENAVTAYRRLFRGLVEDGLWDKNPAEHVSKGWRDDRKRRSMHDWEIDEYIEALVSGGDDPELDLLLGWFALETGARQGGIVSLRLSAIKPATLMIELFEKGKKLGVSVPSCLAHGVALEPRETDDHVRWRCPEGDFSCAVGDYREALWPPGPDDVDEDLGSLLGHRLKRRGLLRGVAHWSVRRHDGMLVGTIALRPTADEAAIREVAEPVALQVTHVEPIATKRLHEPADHLGPARRVLTISGPGAMRAARLEGILRRAGPGDDCDFLVKGRRGGHCVRVRLAPDHRRGGLKGPVVLDHTGTPFADGGDEVVCGGGFNPGSRVEGEPGVFVAGRLSVYEPETLG